MLALLLPQMQNGELVQGHHRWRLIPPLGHRGYEPSMFRLHLLSPKQAEKALFASYVPDFIGNLLVPHRFAPENRVFSRS